MESKKLTPEIFNSQADAIARLAEIFPDAVKDGEVDFTALREELGQFEEVGAERYELTWAGKQAAKKLSQTDVAGRTLKYVPEDSRDADTTQNLYIEGDNLEVLKLLRQNYYGAVKMIYIDPPYNTGNDFVYRDNFNGTKHESDEDEGDTVDFQPMVVNQKSTNRYHANWLNMMLPRLRAAKDLLASDGVIFISIDDNEVKNLRALCDEIFGEENFVAKLVWQSTPGSNTGTNIITVTEYILVYSKLFSDCLFNTIPIADEEKYTLEDEYVEKRGRYVLNKLDRRMTGSHYSDALNYPIEMPDGQMIFPGSTTFKNSDNWNYRWSKTKVAWGVENGFIVFKQDAGVWKAYFKQYLKVDNEDKPIERRLPHQNLIKLEQFNTTQGTRQIMSLLGNKMFDYAKPSELIKYLVNICPDKSALVVDFFSGSSTTAHAVMQLNAEDGGNRRFVMIQLPEVIDEKSEARKAGYKTICEIGKERIRRAGDKIKAEIENGNQQLKLGEEPKQVPDIGFKVFRTADTNIRWAHLALTDGQLDLDEVALTEKDKLDFMPGYTEIDVVYEILLRQRDIPLSASIEKLNIGNRTYMFADAYVVCLEESLDGEEGIALLEALAAIEPTPIKFFIRDSAFNDDISLKDESLRRLAAYIDRNRDEKKTYTVEFI